jgi:hypothetical protein
MHEEPLQKEKVRHAIEHAVAELQHDDPTARTVACERLGIGTNEWAAFRAGLIEELTAAEDWIEREDVRDGARRGLSPPERPA